jgi:hypothetical protein
VSRDRLADERQEQQDAEADRQAVVAHRPAHGHRPEKPMIRASAMPPEMNET